MYLSTFSVAGVENEGIDGKAAVEASVVVRW